MSVRAYNFFTCFIFAFGIILGLTAFNEVKADESAPVENSKAAPKKKKKGKESLKSKKAQGHREKEAEGTEALNRFEANTIIRSRYQQGGQPLEVDPD